MRINVSFEKLKHVVHAADIHIRLFRRHEEYELAFEKFYADIEQLKFSGITDFIIVLAGDIVHAKTDLSPEMVQITSRFLSRVADIAPTLLIAGNHDCNLANTSRLDALSPIVNNLNHSNLHYVRESAIVEVADTSFAVMSIFDEQENWPKPEEMNDGTKIALYHGPVHGAKTDANYEITNRHVHIKTFDGFDIAMLGDIHKHQVLKEENPIIVYASSLIQQNHGESLDGHGWCLWDVPAKSFEFIPLENDYGYVTLEVVNSKLVYPKNMPKNVRMRLFTGDLDGTKVKKIITTLRTNYNIIELSVNKSRFTNVNNSTGSSVSYDQVNLTDISTQNSLIVDFLTRKLPGIDTEVISAIQKINKDLNGRIQHDDQSRNVRWRPLNFKFSNMFSYGEDNEIDFSDMKGVYGLFAGNASGKSSVMDALMFCLYDKTPRAFKGNHIINNRKNDFNCELSFEIDGAKFGISREGKRKKNGEVKVDVEFWKIDDHGKKVSMNGEDRRDTNSNIRSYVGTYEDFVMTALSSQNSNALFIDKSHSERKDLLIQFMGLNIFDKLYDAANDEAKEIVGILKRFKKSDVTDQIATTHAEISDLTIIKDELEVAISDEKIELHSLENDYKAIQSTKKPVPETQMSLEEMEVTLTKTQKKLSNAVTERKELYENLSTLKEQCEELINKFTTYDLKELTRKEREHGTLIATLDLKKNWLDKLETQLSEKQKFKDKLLSYKFNLECSVCVENNKSKVDDLKVVNNEITAILEKKSPLVNEVNDLSQKIIELNFTFTDFERASMLEKKLAQTHQQIDNVKLQIEAKKSVEQKTLMEVQKVEVDIEVYKTNEENILFNKSVDVKLKSIQKNIDEIKKSIDSLSSDLMGGHGKISVLKAKKEDLLAKLKEAEKLEIMYEAYTNYQMATGRDGVPYEMMSKAIPQIESEINNILSQIVDFTVSLEVDGKNINGKLTYDYDRVWPLENSSGMERFVSSLAIRVALMNASNLPKSNFMIIDEGFGVLDAENMHSMQTLFNILKTHFDFILIVSHLDTARDMVDHLIEIKKEDGYSQISV